MKLTTSVVALSSAIIASAMPSGHSVTTTTRAESDCETGSLQCCNSVHKASDPEITNMLGPLSGILYPDPNTNVGVACTPLSVIGLNSNSCTAQPACCGNLVISGLLTSPCTPFQISL
jgi:hypothetical protein